MPVFLLDHLNRFPDPALTSESGMLAVGGDLSLPTLLAAYARGIFPWFNPGDPIIWWCPDPRFILEPAALKIRRSLRKALHRRRYDVTFDHAFDDVIRACARVNRPNEAGTWITNEMTQAYSKLHQAGYAHSVEAWLDERLVGGLYGVCLGRVFFGESMFHLQPDASKVALVELTRRLAQAELIDCQIHTPFFESMGAVHIPRSQFLHRVNKAVHLPDLWQQTRHRLGSSEEAPYT